MISDEKIAAIKKQITGGVPSGEIREKLRNEGYTTEDIEKCFRGKKVDMRSWYLFFGFIFFIAGLFSLFKNGYLLLLIASAAMFYQYYRAEKREKRIE